MTRATASGGELRTIRSGGPSRSHAGARTLVIAAAGYGKTSWVEAHQTTTGYRRVSAAELLVGELDLADRRRLIVEDLHLLSEADQMGLLSRIADRGPELAVTLISREPLDAKVRALVPGPVFEVGPNDLRLGATAVASLLAEEYGLDDPELPTRVHAATAGWPTLVHLCADALLAHPVEDLAAALGCPASPAGAWLESEVIDALPGEVVDLLTEVAPLGLLTAGLVGRVLGDLAPTSWVAETVSGLIRSGLLVRHPRAELLGREGYRLVPALARRLVSQPHSSPEDPRRWRRAASWYEEHDLPFAAVDAYLRAGDEHRAHSLVADQGGRMIAQGDAAGIVRVLTGQYAGAAPTLSLSDPARSILGEALNHTGHPYAAQGALAPLVQTAEATAWDARLAVRVAAVHFSQGELPQARTVLDRVPPSALTAVGDGIRWRAARANVASMLGEQQPAVDLALEALRLAECSGSAMDLAAAHQAVAKTRSGSLKAAHLTQALDAAREAGDAASLARILGNQSYALLAAARCREAVAVSREAVRATELVRPMGALIAALHNLAEALSRSGEYDEARWHLRRAVALSQRIGPNRAASSLAGLGDVHRALGQREQGRAAYEEAVRLARVSQELQVLVPALSGLARLVVDVSPEEARAAATEAVDLATPGLAPYALIALGWVEAVTGDRERAADLAWQAAARARADQSLDLLADALELAGRSAASPQAAERSLAEALAIWRDGEAAPEVWRLELLLGRLETADRTARARAREAADHLVDLGVTSVNGRALGEDPVGKDVEIVILGRFAVTVTSRLVELQAWRSRQARTLVKVLAARRGHPVSRAYLCEALWPDDDPAKTSHRLSVLLTTVRGVLDPAKAWPSDRYVVSDTRGVWLDLRRVSIDADDMLTDAEQGAALLAAGETEAGARLLAAVDEHYGGEAFAEDTDVEWAGVVREETRAAWLRSLRHLATVATQQSRSNDASAILIRLLGVDPYDERVHRGLVRNLVRAGRHGEARRAFERWCEAMREVDAPAPDPAELT